MTMILGIGFPLLEAWLFKDEDRKSRWALRQFTAPFPLINTKYIKIMGNRDG
jgi:hypothetical protein